MSRPGLLKYSVFCKGTSHDFIDGHGYVDTEYMGGDPTKCPLNENDELEHSATIILSQYDINTMVTVDNT
mgnify:CR=1 FL=1